MRPAVAPFACDLQGDLINLQLTFGLFTFCRFAADLCESFIWLAYHGLCVLLTFWQISSIGDEFNRLQEQVI